MHKQHLLEIQTYSDLNHSLRNHDINQGIINGIVFNSVTKNGLPAPRHRETIIAGADIEGRDDV